jgi:hypothetical protein
MTDIYDLQQIDENSWQAHYHGNYGNYIIKLTLDERFNVKKYSCTCPSDYSPCKHIGFVQVEIKDRMSKVQSKNMKNELTVKDVLQNVSLDELRNFVIEKAKYNSDLTQAIMLKFAERIPKTTAGNNYSQIIRDGLNEIDTESEEYYEYEEAFIELDILDEWHKKANDLMEQGKYTDAELICKAGIEEYAYWFDEQSRESEYELECCIENDYQADFFNLLQMMAKNGNIDKKLLYEYCQTEVTKKKYRGIAAFDCFNNLMSALAAEVNPNDFIASQMLMFEKITDKSSHEAEKILQRLINFYNSNNQPDNAEKLIEDNLQINTFCKQAIEKRIAEKRYGEAKTLLNQKLQNCDNWRKNDWKELLLTVAQKEKDVSAIRELALEFLENGFDEQHFKCYKSAFSGEEWTATFEKLYEFYDKPQNQWDKGFITDVAELLQAEKQTERLFEYIEKHLSIELLESYYSNFVQKFPEKTLQLFNKSLDYYANKNLGRNHYEYVNKILEMMQKISGGQEVVKQMTANYRILYKKRRAMMEILNKLK